MWFTGIYRKSVHDSRQETIIKWQNKSNSYMNAGIDTDSDGEVWVQAVCACFHVLCKGVSPLSIASGQHKSDMTFLQDVNLQEMGVTAEGFKI